jgi:hypothetical protein
MEMKHFRGSILFTVLGLLLAGWLGYAETGNVGFALKYVFLAAVLGVMETSLSLDNAVVNASILKDMDPVWQQRFLTWGIAIAVFGMRIIFPIAIVSVAGWITPWEAVNVAITDKAAYEEIVTSAHEGIAGFGGAFLMMVGLSFFLSADKEHCWLGGLERALQKAGTASWTPYAVAAVAIALAAMTAEVPTTVLIAGAAGLLSFFGIEKLGDVMGEEDAAGKVVRTGAAGFIYLEFLDASFSFDGVIGAFAITNDIFLIALGLGIGAMFVRSMTVALVRGGHMEEFRYLEHGAFWAIMALAVIMLLGISTHVPEVVTGLVGAALIGAAWRTSVVHRKAHPEQYVGDDDGEAVGPTGEILGTAR